MTEPQVQRTIAFFDGQNLFHAAREAFGYTFPNYDPKRLAAELCASHGWQLHQVRFHTGVPDPQDNATWHHFWTAKLAQMGREGIWTYQRPLRYRNQTIALPDGTQQTQLLGQEKGIDVRIAIDVVGFAIENLYDVALIFSQDQDLSELAQEIRRIARRDHRWIKLVSAFPVSPTSRNRRGIDGTDWIRIDRTTYDRCIDPRDYRPKKKP